MGSLFVATLPVLMGYVPLGIAFGLLYSQLGLPWLYGILMSVLIFAGSGQFLLVSLLGVGSGLVEMVVATFLLNLRHLFYGLAMIEALRHFGWRKQYIIFALTDETFALLKTLDIPSHKQEKSYFWIALLNQGYWVLGSAIGIALGRAIPFPLEGIEFSLTALFVVLTLELLTRATSYMPFLLAGCVGCAGLFFFPKEQMLLLSLLTTSILLFGVRAWGRYDR